MSEPLVRHHVFPNGLTLLAEMMPGVASAAFTILLPAGTVAEPIDRGGTASLLAEWVVRGAGGRDGRDLIATLDNLGVSHAEGAQTVHSSVSGVTLGRNLISALEIFADVIRRPHLDEGSFEPIRALALQGLQSLEDDPGSKVIYELRKRHFPDPWGRPAMGTVEGLAAITPDDVRAFHRATYHPNGAILAVAGAVDWDRLQTSVDQLFGTWETASEPRLIERPAGPLRDHISKETQQTQIALAVPTVPIGHPDYYLARAAAAILGGYSSARLFTEVREKRGLCYSVYAGYEGFRERAALLGHAGSAPERAQQTLDVTLAEFHRLAAEGVDPHELDTMRAGLKSSLIMQQESTMSRSSSLASDYYFLGRVRSLDEIAGALDALTAEAVSRFAAGLPIDQATILTLGPSPLVLPDSP